MLSSEFAFTLCQRGAEAALKRELARIRPTWAPAYQRPGLVSFRAGEPVTPELSLESVFARSYGMSLGTVRDRTALFEQVARLPAPLRLHVSERDLYRPDEAPKGALPGALAAELEAELRAGQPERFLPGVEAKPGELVLDVVVAPDDPLLVGLHRHRLGRCPFPGGRYPIEIPEDAPSRAYAKIEEAILAFDLPFRPGDVALEIGAAPGGAAFALLARGVSVIGVDPGDMDPRVLDFTGPGGVRLVHHKLAVGALEKQQLPARIDWLLLDVHLAPQVALRAALRVASWLKRTLCGVVLTLKLNDWAFAERIPSFVEQVRQIGIRAPQVKQLAAHRQEIAIAGLTARGVARLHGPG